MSSTWAGTNGESAGSLVICDLWWIPFPLVQAQFLSQFTLIYYRYVLFLCLFLFAMETP